MNYLYTKVSAVREQLILFANQIESLDFEYNAVVAELEQSFTDSNSNKVLGLWEKGAQNGSIDCLVFKVQLVTVR